MTTGRYHICLTPAISVPCQPRGPGRVESRALLKAACRWPSRNACAALQPAMPYMAWLPCRAALQLHAGAAQPSTCALWAWERRTKRTSCPNGESPPSRCIVTPWHHAKTGDVDALSYTSQCLCASVHKATQTMQIPHHVVEHHPCTSHTSSKPGGDARWGCQESPLYLICLFLTKRCHDAQ